MIELQSIMENQREKRRMFSELWNSKILPRIAELTKHVPKDKSSAEIAINMAELAAWIAFNK